MSFPATPLNISVEVALSADPNADPSTWAWTDATAYVLARDGITINRGGYDGQVQSPPSTCRFTVDNTDGRWVPTNPTGAWYGQISKGTPVRVVVDEGTPSVRWTGFLTSLPPRWDPSESQRTVTVAGTGIMGRLQRGSTPLRSALVRTISGTSTPPKAYWPGEDGSGATALAEFFGGQPMRLTGQTVTLASDGPDGSSPLPEFTTVAGCIGAVPPHPVTGAWTVGSVFKVPAAPSAETVILKWTTTGSLPLWYVTIDPATPTVNVQAFDTTGATILNDGVSFTAAEIYDTWLMLLISGVQNGTGIDYIQFALGPDGGGGNSGTIASQTVGTVRTIGQHANSKANGMHAGHWAAWDFALDLSGFTDVDNAALDGYDGESVYSRSSRLGGEEGVFVYPLGPNADTTTLMGPQQQNTFLEALRECEAATNGRLIEMMDPSPSGFLLGLLSHSSIENQAVALTLDHDAGELAPPFEPTDDDTYLRNDWTATRVSAAGTGSSARVEADSGNLTPAKVGRWADSVGVNVETDDQLADQAGWRVNVGTAEGLRFPVVTLNFARNPSLIASWVTLSPASDINALDIGARIQVTNPPTGIAPDAIDLMIEGWTEVFSPYTWYVNINCSPYRPWHVFQLAQTSSDTDAFLGRLAEDEDCALRAAATSSALSLTVDPNRTFWTTTADDFPLSIMVGGEQITVSSIATTAATFVAAGTQSNGDNSTRTPSLPAGTTTGDLLLIFAAIRSTTATVDGVTGYTRLTRIWPATANVAVFAKVSTASESSPSVSFTGGAAGDTCSAVMLAFRGTPVSLSDLNDIVVDCVTQLNASAQNIAYGGLYPWRQERCIILALGWKQDDWTSVATIATGGFTEAVDGPTTSGNDQGLVVDYVIQTTPSVISEGSFTVTGGASAISRSAVVALASGYQTFTLSARGVNNVSKAQTANTKVAVNDPAVLAL